MSSFSIALGTTMVVVSGALIATPFVLGKYAAKDSFFTHIKPGDGKMFLRGESFDKFEISYPGHHLNRPGAFYFDRGIMPWQILENGKLLDDDYFDTRPQWMRDFGLDWIGVPGQKKISARIFEWKEESLAGIRSRSELTKIFKVNKAPYVVEHSTVMSADKLLVKMRYVLGLRIINPFLSHIATEDWLVQVEAIARQQARNWAGGFDFEDLISQTDGKTKGEIERENFLVMMQKMNVFIEDSFGVTLVTAELVSVEADGPDSLAYLKALNAPFVAKQEATVTVTKGEAQAAALKAVGLAQAEVDKQLALAKAAGERVRYEAAQAYPEAARLLNGATAFVFPASIDNLVNTFADNMKRT